MHLPELHLPELHLPELHHARIAEPNTTWLCGAIAIIKIIKIPAALQD
ncbi:MAG TPA: hypothetical protein VHE99_11310 [Gammaproteobacteria bacterium]|nr:hypothetical protein [Gammaproteobacteria bacterium]